MYVDIVISNIFYLNKHFFFNCVGSVQVFRKLNEMSSQSSVYKADKIKVLKSLDVDVVSDFLNHICCTLQSILY